MTSYDRSQMLLSYVPTFLTSSVFFSFTLGLSPSMLSQITPTFVHCSETSSTGVVMRMTEYLTGMGAPNDKYPILKFFED